MSKEFLDINFDGKNLSDFNLTRVASGDRYQISIVPTFSNSRTDVPGKIGSIIWKPNITGDTLNFNIATDGMTSRQFMNLKAHFYPRKMGKLILAESPYKYTFAIIDQKTDLTFLPFESEINIGGNIFNGTIYKGEATLVFSLSDPNWYSDLSLGDSYKQEDWFLESGLPLQSMLPTNVTFLSNGIRANRTTIVADTTQVNPTSGLVYYYNSGTGKAPAKIYFYKQMTSNTNGVTMSPISIGNLVITKPRTFVDIDYTIQLLLANSSTWNSTKQAVLNTLRDELDSPLKSELIGITQATGTGLAWNTVAAAVTQIGSIVNGKQAYFSIDSIENQSLLRIEVTGHDFGSTITQKTLTIEENIGGSTNNQYIFLDGSIGIKEDGTIDVKTLSLSDNTLRDFRMYFKNTYA